MPLIGRLLYKRSVLDCAVLLIAVSGSSIITGCGSSSAAVHAPGFVPSVSTESSASLQTLGTAFSASRAQSISLARYDATILADKPVAYYPLDDVTPLLLDHASSPRDGNYGSATRLGVEGITSTGYRAAAFPGGDYAASRVATVLPTAKLQPALVSVEAWVESSALNTSNRPQPIVSYGRFAVGVPYQLTVSPINQFFFSVKTPTRGYSTVATTASTPGQIFHIVGTYDGSSVELYVNGVLQGQTAASGPLNYGGLYASSGLAVGSGLDAVSSHPIESYAGTIADVSIYSYALTSAQVMNHYLTGVATPALTERPTQADAFVDSIGVNAPFNYQETAYDTDYNVVKPLLISSGIRHIRSGMAQNWPTYYDRLNELGRAGIHSELVTVGTESASLLETYPALVSQSIEAYEGPNEPDSSGDPNWMADTSAFMRRLYAAVKGNAATAKLSIIGPSVFTPAGEAEIGNLSADMNYGNIHPYYGINNPGNTGTGGITPFGRFGSIGYFLGEEAQISGSKPAFATETGYGTDLAFGGNVSELCDGKESLRTYLEHFKHGIVRTLPYQLVEQGSAYGTLGFFSYMGLLRQDLSPKPSYNAIKSLIALLSDKGPSFTTSSLTYTIRGNVNNLDHFLMQKRNGLYYLALWLEVPSWDGARNQDINASPQEITVTLPKPMMNGYSYVVDDAGNMSRSISVFSNETATLRISDRVTVLAFQAYP